MQRYLIIILLVLMGLMLVACEDDAELRIRNRTNASITAKVDEGDEFTIEAWSGWSRIYGQDTNVTVNYEGLYVYPNFVNRTVTQGLPTTVNVYPDCGAIRLNNDSPAVITEINISRHDATEWGENLIVDNMLNGTDLTWSIRAGNWDIRVIPESGSPIYKMDQVITDNETLELLISEFGAHAKYNKTPGGNKPSELILRETN
ncbi:MAG TPA: hypothetical protein PL126_03320 [Candidatus Cloacimonadota bacterium]|nr:hypothetical protein [Candidatus Cloacimonadota bacterium]